MQTSESSGDAQPTSTPVRSVLSDVALEGSSADAIPAFCADYTSYLKNVTNDVLKPFILDISPYYTNESLVVYITINTMHMRNYNTQKSTDYEVIFEDNRYPNLYTMADKNVGYNQLKFVLHTAQSYKQYDIVTFSLYDKKNRYTYSDLKACVRIPPAVRHPLITCSYISDYNTIAELRAFVAFHRVQNVSMVVFYQATPIPGFTEAFAKMVSSGYVTVVDFTWPRPFPYAPLQLNNQQGQMNSCFNHFRFDADAILFCDVDEYIYSQRYPYHLPDVLNYTETHYPKHDVFTVESVCLDEV